MSVADVCARYDFPARWVERRLEEWERAGVLVRGTFGADRAVTRWCSRRLLEQARRRELAQARKAIEAVGIDAFARFVQRWQHLTPHTRLAGASGTAEVLAQLHGLARPAEGWERDYLPARLREFAADDLARLAASGALVWAAERSATSVIGRIRFFARGTGRLWLAPPPDDEALSVNARAVRDVLRAQGASFTADLSSTGLASGAIRDALYELVATGVVTNDTIEALRDVVQHKPSVPVKRFTEADAARWLPADFTPSARPIVQRRVNPRRLAKWKRPDREERQGWGGRWSLVHLPGTLGAEADEQQLAEAVARQWLARYGIVSRDWWRRERPAVGWRSIYHELKRLEFRGEVRRGYFVAGLAGAQFALPDAVEMLRAPPTDDDTMVAMATSDPANVYTLPVVAGTATDPLGHPRGAGAMLVTRGGRIVLTAERRGTRLRVRHDASATEVCDAARVLAERLLLAPGGGRRRRDLVVETINGVQAALSEHADALREAGYRSMGTGLRYFVTG